NEAGAPVTAHRVDSDVNYVLRVDPTQTPDQLADAVRTWADQEIHRISQQPTGLASAKARWLTFARDAGSQALASAVLLVTAREKERGQVAASTDLPQGAQIERVAGTEHTFRLVFEGAHNRPEQLTFEIRTGVNEAGAPVTAERVDSDVNYVLRVDPTQTPDQIADAVRDWANQEIHRISQQPTGPQRGQVARKQVAFSNYALVATGSKELSNISYDGNEAVTSQSRSELLKRHISTAGEEHLATFRADADG
ncbi:hypothetical protein, partial [Micromonospora sonneratiae]